MYKNIERGFNHSLEVECGEREIWESPLRNRLEYTYEYEGFTISHSTDCRNKDSNIVVIDILKLDDIKEYYKIKY